MTSSLVGSEMCIRDRDRGHVIQHKEGGSWIACHLPEEAAHRADLWSQGAVSYTHLTLPTICSV
eukprot:332449-Prorocentrum_lima.AAC.1